MLIEFKRRLYWKDKMYSKGDQINTNQINAAYLISRDFAEEVKEKEAKKEKKEKEFKHEEPVTKEAKPVAKKTVKRTWKDDK